MDNVLIEALASAKLLGDMDQQVFTPEEGYDLAAAHYDDWRWQTFWKRNERPLVQQLIDDASNVRDVLDIGCGTGSLLESLVGKGFRLAGSDISEEMVKVTHQKLGDAADIRRASILELPWKSASFDLVTACRMFSHVGDLPGALREVRRVTRVGGKFILTDLHGTQNYPYTRVSGPWGEVRIEVFKKTPEDIIAAAETLGWKLLRQEDFRVDNIVWVPLAADFPSIDWSGVKPIGFLLFLEATG